MGSRILARNALAMVAQVVISALALLATYWLLLRALSIEEIGLLSLVAGTAAMARLSEMGLGGGVLRFVAADLAAGEPSRAASSVGMVAVLVLALVGALALIGQPLLAHYLARLVPPALHGALLALLPPTLLAVVTGTVAGVFLSAIDGCQRMDLRARLMVLGSLVQLGATWFVLPRWGLAGLGWVQLAQSGFLLVAAIAGAGWLLARPLRDYFRFDGTRLGELARYGGGLQLSALGQMAFDPLLKVLLTLFSGLALAGYHDLAFRILGQFRAVIVAGFSALVPHVAARSADYAQDPGLVRQVYRQAASVLVFLALPYLAVLASGLPLALTLWKGQFDPVLLGVALLQLVVIGVNLLTVPAYLVFTGIGRLRWTIASHFSVTVLVVLIGWPLGMIAGGAGVLAGAALAQTGASLIVVLAFAREFDLALWQGWSSRLLAPLALLGGAYGAGTALAGGLLAPSWLLLWGLPLLVAAPGAVLVWRNPVRRTLFAQLPLFDRWADL